MAGLVAMVSVLALAVPATGVAAPAGDSVVGGFDQGAFCCGESIAVAARSGPSGENPSGRIVLASRSVARVICLRVNGREAMIAGENETPSFFGRGVVLFVRDNQGFGIPDQWSLLFTIFPPTPAACLFLPGALTPAQHGNVIVRDG